MIIIFIIGIALIPFKDSTPKIILGCIRFLEIEYRESIINFMGVLIGIFHFYYVGRHNDKFPTGLMRILFGLFTSVATAFGYAVLMNKGLDFAIGILKDFLQIEPFFVCREKVDFLTLALISVFVVFLAAYLLWQMAEDSLYEIVQPSAEVEAVPDAGKEEQQTKTPTGL